MAKKRERKKYVPYKQKIAEHNRKASLYRKGLFGGALLSLALIFNPMSGDDNKKDMEQENQNTAKVTSSYDDAPMSYEFSTNLNIDSKQQANFSKYGINPYGMN